MSSIVAISAFFKLWPLRNKQENVKQLLLSIRALLQHYCIHKRIIRWRGELSYYRNANQEACLFFMSLLIERTKEYNAADSTLKETDVRVTSTIELKCLT